MPTSKRKLARIKQRKRKAKRKAKAKASTSVPFEVLPAELRQNVYEYYFSTLSVSWVVSPQSAGLKRKTIPLLRVSKAIRKEALNAFHRHATFIMPPSPHVQQALTSLSLRKVRNVELLKEALYMDRAKFDVIKTLNTMGIRRYVFKAPVEMRVMSQSYNLLFVVRPMCDPQAEVVLLQTCEIEEVHPYLTEVPLSIVQIRNRPKEIKIWMVRTAQAFCNIVPFSDKFFAHYPTLRGYTLGTKDIRENVGETMQRYRDYGWQAIAV